MNPDPWRDDNRPDHPSSATSRWGCALAAIIGSVAVVVAVVIVLTVANGFAGDILRELR